MKFNIKKTKTKVDAWLDHAITRRDYVNMFGACLGVYTLSAAAVLIWYKVSEAKAEKLYQEEKEKMDYTNDEEVDI